MPSPSLAALLRHYSGTTQDIFRKDVKNSLYKSAAFCKLKCQLFARTLTGTSFGLPEPRNETSRESTRKMILDISEVQ